jgi:anti-sigma B factor antagonist
VIVSLDCPKPGPPSIKSLRMESYAANGSQGLATISTDRVADAVVVSVDGEIDILTGPPLRRALADALDEHDGRPVVTDLTRVKLLSSTGLAVLVDAHWHAEQRGRRFVLVVDPGVHPVRLALQMAGIATLFTVVADLQEALYPVG